MVDEIDIQNEFEKEADFAFKHAIKTGVLSENPQDTNFIGMYMYMFAENGQYFFKNIITRRYVKSPITKD